MRTAPRPPTSRPSTPGTPTQAPTAAVNLGVLLEEQGDADGAKAAYQQAIDSGHADQAPKAAVNLGVLLKEQGDADGAKAAYQQAIDSGHPDQAPMAAFNLGVLLKEQGDADGAKAAYQQAIDSGHADAGADGRGQPGGPAEGAGGCGRRQGRLPAGHRLRARRCGADGRVTWGSC